MNSNMSENNNQRKRVSIGNEYHLYGNKHSAFEKLDGIIYRVIIYNILFKLEQLSHSKQNLKNMRRSHSNNEEEDQNSSFISYEFDDDEHGENLNYLDLDVNYEDNSESFEETIRNFKKGIQRVSHDHIQN